MLKIDKKRLKRLIVIPQTLLRKVLENQLLQIESLAFGMSIAKQ